MNHYADDLAALTAHLDLKNAIHVGHSTGGGEVTRYLVRHGESRVAKAVLISAVPPADGEDGDQSSRPSQGSVRRIAGAACGQSLAVLSRASGGAFYGYNRPSLISAWRYAALPIGPSNVRI
jgi:non-heme chloroperoxidase